MVGRRRAAVKQDPPVDMSATSRSGTATVERPVIRSKSITIEVPAVSAEQGRQSSSEDRYTSATPQWTGDGVKQLGHNVKQLVTTITKLDELGIPALEIPVPKIVVVGDQSAGKSSLVEAISQITVPRSAGTCTRCPLYISLRQDDNPNASWRCSVFLHKTHHYLPDETNEPSDFGHWKESNGVTDAKFEEVHDPKKLEDCLRRAQIAILNPGRYHTDFSGASANMPELMQTSFSPNMVRLEIHSPTVPNLAFYDLPGVVNQLPKGNDPLDLQLVQNLMRRHIRDPNALILLACSLEGDLHNSTAARIVRDEKAETRCLGVLTKPDRLEKLASHGYIEDVLNGESFEFGHGYFVVKQPKQEELEKGITHAQAREDEAEFFRSNAPWSTMQEYADQFGTIRLQDRLSKLLTHNILEILPELIQRIDEKLLHADKQLQNMPEPATTQFQLTIVDLLHAFKSSLENAIKGEHPNHELRQHRNALFEDLVDALHKMRPSLRCQSLKEQQTRVAFNSSPESSFEVVHIDDSDGEPDVTPLSNKRKRTSVAPAPTPTPSKRLRAAAQTPSPAGRSGTKQSFSSSSFSTPTSSSSQGSTGLRKTEHAKRYTLEGVRQVIKEVSTSQLQGPVNPKAIDILIADALTNLHIPVEQFYEIIRKAMIDRVMSLMKVQLTRWADTPLAAAAPRVVERELSQAFADAKKNIDRAVRLELHRPLTFNKDLHEMYRLRDLTNYETARRNSRLHAAIDEEEMRFGKRTEGDARAKKIKMAEDKGLEPDPFQNEVNVMSWVTSYYSIATGRLVDYIGQTLEMDFLDKIKMTLCNDLFEGLGILGENANERCMQLLSEDPRRAETRKRLQSQVNRLKQAKSELSKLGLDKPEMMHEYV